MLHLTQHAAGVLANQTSLAHVSQQQVQLHTEIIWGETNGSSHSSKPRLSFSSHFVCVLKGVWDTSSLKRHNTYFLLAFDIPLPPASSSSSTSWGRLFSFSIFLGGPPKKSPMPFCQVGVGRGHTGFPPVYLFFAASYNNYSSLSTWSVCVCVCGETRTDQVWGTGCWRQRWMNWHPETSGGQKLQQLQMKCMKPADYEGSSKKPVEVHRGPKLSQMNVKRVKSHLQNVKSKFKESLLKT